LLGPDPAVGFVGLALLRELCVTYTAELPIPPTIILSGGGFVDTHELGVPYCFDDHPKLAAWASELSHERTVVGPVPGQVLQLVPHAHGRPISVQSHPAVTSDPERLAKLRARPRPVGPLPLRTVLPSLDPAGWSAALTRVDRSLQALVAPLMAHPQGDAILGCHRWNDRVVGPHRVLLRLVDGPDGRVAWRALDLRESRFVALDGIDEATILQVWPFGIEVGLQDLDGLLSGTLLIWDVLGVALRHWSAHGPGMASALCALLSEAARPEATAVALADQLNALGHPTHPEQLVSPSPLRDSIEATADALT
ncbi:MAG TPA: hypothetical protein DFR83_27580, partial [Deltaproteobacteria bacterium]|nr:hypothetical protein [Deltaproteobacteria bacterium]